MYERWVLSPKRNEVKAMDGKTAMIKGITIGEERERLDQLFEEGEGFLQQWGAYIRHDADAPVDAYIAISEMQRDILARRAYIAGMNAVEKLPF